MTPDVAMGFMIVGSEYTLHINLLENAMTEEENKTETRTNKEYFAETDPKTGKRYSIPMLNTKNPQYFTRYVEYMKLKEKHPEQFQKIMNWE